MKKKAIEITPRDHPILPTYMSDLGHSLTMRFQRTGNMHDLEAAIADAKRAVEYPHQEHPSRVMYLSGALQTRFERIDDLDASIDSMTETVNRTPEEHSDRASYLSNLSSALHDFDELVRLMTWIPL
jgi:hypothetical protein